MRPGADIKSQSSTMTEETFREALELAHRVNRRITDTDLVRRDPQAKTARADDSAQR
jgi:hypothetical protein